MFERAPCNICNAVNYKILAKDGPANIVRCTDCRLVYRSPRKDKQDYLQVYYDSYYTPANKDWWYKRKIDFFKRAVQKIGQLRKNRGRLLDLGCGFGFFLDLARAAGWEAIGLEVSDYASAYARDQLKLKIFHGELEAAHFPGAYFDVVTMWNFLDHLFDPLGLLIEVNRILKTGGLVVMRMPNMYFQLPGFRFFKRIERMAQVAGIKNPFVVHNYSFSRRTLKTMLAAAGFKDIRVENSRFSRRPLALINHCLFCLFQLLFYLSGEKILLAPTLQAYAYK